MQSLPKICGRSGNSSFASVVAIAGQGTTIQVAAGAGGTGSRPGVGLASAAGGVSLATVASATLSRASRHSSDIMDSPVFKPLGLSPDFVPQKSCLEYVVEECTRALPEIRLHVQALVQAGREVIDACQSECVAA